MSCDYFLACAPRRLMIHLAQDGMGGRSFYSGEPKTMEALGRFLWLTAGEPLRFVAEQGPEWEACADFEEMESP